MYHLPSYVFNTPCTILVSGSTGSGKTTWIKKLLANDVLFKNKPDKVVYCYETWQTAFDSMNGVEFRQGIDIPNNTSNQHLLVILDDLMSDVVQSPQAEELFTKGSHHKNITVIFIVQNLFPQGKCARTIMLNSHYLVLFKNPRDIQQINYLGRQLGLGQVVVEAYKDCMQVPYGYLLVDLSPHNNDDLKLKTNIFPKEDCIVYFSKR